MYTRKYRSNITVGTDHTTSVSKFVSVLTHGDPFGSTAGTFTLSTTRPTGSTNMLMDGGRGIHQASIWVRSKKTTHVDQITWTGGTGVKELTALPGPYPDSIVPNGGDGTVPLYLALGASWTNAATGLQLAAAQPLRDTATSGQEEWAFVSLGIGAAGFSIFGGIGAIGVTFELKPAANPTGNNVWDLEFILSWE